MVDAIDNEVVVSDETLGFIVVVILVAAVAPVVDLNLAVVDGRA